GAFLGRLAPVGLVLVAVAGELEVEADELLLALADLERHRDHAHALDALREPVGPVYVDLSLRALEGRLELDLRAVELLVADLLLLLLRLDDLELLHAGEREQEVIREEDVALLRELLGRLRRVGVLALLLDADLDLVVLGLLDAEGEEGL